MLRKSLGVPPPSLHHSGLHKADGLLLVLCTGPGIGHGTSPGPKSCLEQKDVAENQKRSRVFLRKFPFISFLDHFCLF